MPNRMAPMINIDVAKVIEYGKLMILNPMNRNARKNITHNIDNDT